MMGPCSVVSTVLNDGTIFPKYCDQRELLTWRRPRSWKQRKTENSYRLEDAKEAYLNAR